MQNFLEAVDGGSLAQFRADGINVAVMTSGGDAQGMNAAVRAVVRATLTWGGVPFAIQDGWRGAVRGDGIRQLSWNDVANILHRGGTIVGTARCPEFQERDGMRSAVKHLVHQGIDRMVCIGGDGSLSGARELSELWPELLQELVDHGEVDAEVAQRHPTLIIVGLVGSIDNDLVGTDMTIGADSALLRIVEALDAISSTAASHQRNFVIEVMGRNCGYLALMAAVAGSCDYVLIPELPPGPQWREELCESLRHSRSSGRKDSLVLIAEGVKDTDGNPVKAQMVADAIAESTGEQARVTILGHVQRGGRPSAYDRWMSTVLGVMAARQVLAATVDTAPSILGVHRNRLVKLDMVEAISTTRAVGAALKAGDAQGALAARGKTFSDMVDIFHRITTPPSVDADGERRRRIAVLHAGGLAPGMNAAVVAAVRLGVERGYEIVGVQSGFGGFARGECQALTWADVDGWCAEGGAQLGSRRAGPSEGEISQIADVIRQQRIDAVLMVGGYLGYQASLDIVKWRDYLPQFAIPWVCVPATIDNNLPDSELSIGADSALNAATIALDGIKQSASAHRRCFIVEVMGRNCGYLALSSALACGAEQVYMHETGVTAAGLLEDVHDMRESFRGGKRLFVAIRSEGAHSHYDVAALATVFDAESEGLYDVRTNVIGHLQQGCTPSPFDRIQAVRLVSAAIEDLAHQLESGTCDAKFVGLHGGSVRLQPLAAMGSRMDVEHRRPQEQWWMSLRSVFEVVGGLPAR